MRAAPANATPRHTADHPRFSRRALARRALRHYARAHVPLAAGVALAATVLSGAQLVGHAVRATLARFARERLGDVAWAVALPPGRRVADTLAAGGGGGSVLTLPAALALDREDGTSVEVPAARVLGVDAAAWRLIAGPGSAPPDAGEVLLGAALAARLGARPDDRVALRAAVWSPLPRDAPLASRAAAPATRWRARVRAVLPDAQGGRFGLEAAQRAPLNAFVALPDLQERTGGHRRANLLLFAEQPAADWAAGSALADLGLFLAASNGVARLTADTIFLPDAALQALPPDAVPTLTYLVDAIARADGQRRTPYSFVMGATPQPDPRLGLSADSDGIAANAWLAEQLALTPGDTVTLAFRRWEADGRVVSASLSSPVARIVPMDAATTERHRLPDFPGLTDVERCADWDVGMDMHPDDLADAANEAYWKAFGPTPKAFLPLALAQQIVGTRFGAAMDARIPLPDASAEAFAALERRLRQRLDLAALGLTPQPVRAQAARGARGATDFGGLFLGLSFFLVAAALLLAGLLCALGIARRGSELGTLRILGFADATIFRQMLSEHCALVSFAAPVGAGLGALYAWGLLAALGGAWSDALAGAAPAFVWSAGSVATGALAAAGASVLVLFATLRRALWRPPRDLLDPARTTPTPTARRFRAGAAAASLVGLAVAFALATRGPAGALLGGLLVLSLAVVLYRQRTRRAAFGRPGPVRTLAQAGRRGELLRPGRGLAVMTVLSCGVFMLCAVTAMRQNPARHPERRTSPTGGFGQWLELSVPVAEWELAPLADPALTPLRTLPGEDAGCLNLNAVTNPRLIGVPTRRFAELNVFGLGARWLELDAARSDGTTPAWSGDRDTARWGLRARLDPRAGTVLTRATEREPAWRLRLTDAPPHRMTLFQGALLVSATRLAEVAPAAGGYDLLLVDAAAAGGGATLADRIRRRLARHGVAAEGVVARIRAHYRVEATYLDMFLVLGGLGLAVATLGVGLVAVRNAEERRDELRALALMGVPRGARARLLWEALAPPQVAGLAAGALAALVALWPALWRTGAGVPWRNVAGMLLLVAVSGGVWSIALAWRAARGAATARVASVAAGWGTGADRLRPSGRRHVRPVPKVG